MVAMSIFAGNMESTHLRLPNNRTERAGSALSSGDWHRMLQRKPTRHPCLVQMAMVLTPTINADVLVMNTENNNNNNNKHHRIAVVMADEVVTIDKDVETTKLIPDREVIISIIAKLMTPDELGRYLDNLLIHDVVNL